MRQNRTTTVLVAVVAVAVVIAGLAGCEEPQRVQTGGGQLATKPTTCATTQGGGYVMPTPPKPRPAYTVSTQPAKLIDDPSSTDGRKIYVVEDGDDLYSISVRVYGNGNGISLIAKANPDVAGKPLVKGTRLVIPKKPAGFGNPPSKPTPTPTPSPVDYDVRTTTMG